jgi:hypothetical protein
MIIGERICVRHSLEELRFRGAGTIHPSPFDPEITDIVKIYYTRVTIGSPFRVCLSQTNPYLEPYTYASVPMTLACLFDLRSTTTLKTPMMMTKW